MFRFSLKKVIYLIIFILIFIPIISINFYFTSFNFSERIPSEQIKTANGYSEVDLSILPEIDYGRLNDLWYDPKIEMLIITPNRTDFIKNIHQLFMSGLTQ